MKSGTGQPLWRACHVSGLVLGSTWCCWGCKCLEGRGQACLILVSQASIMPFNARWALNKPSLNWRECALCLVEEMCWGDAQCSQSFPSPWSCVYRKPGGKIPHRWGWNPGLSLLPCNMVLEESTWEVCSLTHQLLLIFLHWHPSEAPSPSGTGFRNWIPRAALASLRQQEGEVAQSVVTLYQPPVLGNISVPLTQGFLTLLSPCAVGVGWSL